MLWCCGVHKIYYVCVVWCCGVCVCPIRVWSSSNKCLIYLTYPRSFVNRSLKIVNTPLMGVYMDGRMVLMVTLTMATQKMVGRNMLL